MRRCLIEQYSFSNLNQLNAATHLITPLFSGCLATLPIADYLVIPPIFGCPAEDVAIITAIHDDFQPVAVHFADGGIQSTAKNY